MRLVWEVLCLWFCFLSSIIAIPHDDTFSIGVGRADITGTAAEVGMMGYSMLGQTTAGLHFRLWSRAFVFLDSEGHRVVFVNADACMIFNEVKQAVLQLLRETPGMLNSFTGEALYTDQNVLISGTHTHAGPGGFSFRPLYDMTTLGFQESNYKVLIEGIAQSIIIAHNNLKPGSTITMGRSELLNSNINRSPTSYLENPEIERAQYEYDVDKDFLALFMKDSTGKDFASLNWFAVHGTSMNNTNSLISGDNKGHAEALFEAFAAKNFSSPNYVAAFAQSAAGDVSPNTRGAFCPNGDRCEPYHSTCDGKTENCRGLGPGKNDVESTKIIATNQFNTLKDLFEASNNTLLTGSIDYRHTYIDIAHTLVSSAFTSTGKDEYTCIGALGDSFAGGTTDGPGAFNFKQGTNSSKENPVWNWLGGFLGKPTKEQIQCHLPKPILLPVGITTYPAPWSAHIVPLQILKIGYLYIVGVPGEPTTMSGRRLRKTIRDFLQRMSNEEDEPVVVIAGLSNEYTHYITTYEEYQPQRYEAASTLFGPHTLAAYQQEFAKLAISLRDSIPLPPVQSPPFEGSTFNLLPGVLVDFHPTGKPFGTVEKDVEPLYRIHDGPTIIVEFWGGNPRNDLQTGKTFLTVEKKSVNSPTGWEVVLTDNDWETKFRWRRAGLGESLLTVEWDVSVSVLEDLEGIYIIRHFGHSKSITGKISPYSGQSSQFVLQ